MDNDPTPIPFWEPEPWFKDQSIVIVGSGPSLATLDLDLLKGHRFIVVNSGCRKLRSIATKDDVLYFTDNGWNENRPSLAEGWPGPVICANRHVKARLKDAVRFLDVTALTFWIEGFPDHVQASSAHIAACLAVRMGARRLVLFGMECMAVDGLTHGHADYQAHDLKVFSERFLPAWRGLAKVFTKRGVEVVNATPVSAIPDFVMLPLDEAL